MVTGDCGVVSSQLAEERSEFSGLTGGERVPHTLHQGWERHTGRKLMEDVRLLYRAFKFFLDKCYDGVVREEMAHR